MLRNDDREYQYYSKLMDAIELVHVENCVIMGTLCRMFLKDEDFKDVQGKTIREWNDTFKQIRDNWS